MELMFLNQGATGDWAPGSRESGFFSSIGRSFSLQGATVMDHWEGFGDVVAEDEQMVDVPTFQNMVGDRDLPAPGREITIGQAQRLIEQYDREQREMQYETNVRSAIGSFVGGTLPWAVSPEGLVGLAIPPLRARSIAKSVGEGAKTTSRLRSGVDTAVDQMGTRTTTSTPTGAGGAFIGARSEVPAAIMTGGTNMLAQAAAYGEVDALEASLAFGAPLVFGAGIGAVQASRAASRMRARDTGVRSNPTSTDTSPDKVNVPSGLQQQLTETLGLTPEDTTETFFQKLNKALEDGNIDEDLADNLREAFARTGVTRRQDLSPAIKRAARQLDDAERVPVGETPEALKTRVADLNKQVKNASRRVKRAEAKLADASGDEAKALTKKVKEDRKLLNELREQRKGLSGRTAEVDQARVNEQVDARVQTNRRVQAQREVVDEVEQRLTQARRAVDQATDDQQAARATSRVGEIEDRLRAEQQRLEEITARTRNKFQRRLGLREAADPMGRRVSVREALKQLADEVSKTDQPLPAEFVAEFLELYQGRRPISKEALRGVETPDVDDYATTRRGIEEELENDPGTRAFKGKPGYDEALETQTRVEEILENCPL